MAGTSGLADGVEQYTFRVDLGGASGSGSGSGAGAGEGATATYSDVDTMCAAALTQLLMHDATKPKVSKDVNWTVLIKSHEVVAGPNDGLPPRRDGGVGTAGAGAGAGAGSANDSVLAPGSNWIRVDSGDRAGALAAPPSPSPSPSPSLPSVRALPLKSIHAGPLSIQLSYDTPR
jgi:hypothetical protein